jgi:hypothetical protein
MDIVAGFLEIDGRDGTHEIVVKHAALNPDANGCDQFVLLPRQARHLANLLVEYAALAEAEIADSQPDSASERSANHLGNNEYNLLSNRRSVQERASQLK